MSTTCVLIPGRDGLLLTFRKLSEAQARALLTLAVELGVDIRDLGSNPRGRKS